MLRIPKNRITTHPGEVLLEDFLRPLDLSQSALARHIDRPVQVINEIVRGKRGISPEMAILLGQALDTTAEFWVNLNAMYELSAAVQKRERAAIRPLRPRHEAPA